jgi:hypothetical protein
MLMQCSYDNTCTRSLSLQARRTSHTLAIVHMLGILC